MIKAEIIAIGSELLTPFRSDTNSLYLTRSLEECGVRVVAKTIVGDELEALVFAFQAAFTRSDVVICSGGLGPTTDDLTRDALSKFLNIPMNFHPDILARIEERFQKMNLKMPAINRKQAMVPEGATVLENHHGTAPGIYLDVGLEVGQEAGAKQVFLLPGPPFELEPMWEKYALPLLRKDLPFHRKIFRIAMLGESYVDEMLKPVSSSLRDVQYTILASPSEIEIHLLAPQSSMEEMINASAEIRIILGNKIYAEDQVSLEEVVGLLLKQKRKTVAVAESCTGGLLAQRLTSIAGSSDYFERGVVTYSNLSKTDLAVVPTELIAKHGAVSKPVAAAMAQGICKLAKSDYGLSITGIAGPAGGTADKPVGLVYVGLSDGNEMAVHRYQLIGNRNRVRFSASQAALNLLRLKLI